MNLKEQLFPDTNITGYTDRYNKPILVGQTIIDEDGCLMKVHLKYGKYVVCLADKDIEEHGTWVSLSSWMAISEWVEIVVPAKDPDTTPVAMAPFNKEHNRAIPTQPIKKGRRSY